MLQIRYSILKHIPVKRSPIEITGTIFKIMIICLFQVLILSVSWKVKFISNLWWIDMNYYLTATSSAGNFNSFDWIRIQQVNLPPWWRFFHSFRTPFTIVNSRFITVISISWGPSADCRRLIRWLPYGNIQTCKNNQIYDFNRNILLA